MVTLDKKLFKRLVESMWQMDEIVRGVRAPSREFYVDAAKVKEIRAITGLSQPKFACTMQNAPTKRPQWTHSFSILNNRER